MNRTNAVMCSDGPGFLTLTANTVAGRPLLSYVWSRAASKQTITVTSAGTYTVGVTDLITNCPPIGGTVVVTAAATLAAPAAASNSPVCIGSTINLSASLIAGATYSWTGPSAFTSALQNPTRPAATAA